MVSDTGEGRILRAAPGGAFPREAFNEDTKTSKSPSGEADPSIASWFNLRGQESSALSSSEGSVRGRRRGGACNSTAGPKPASSSKSDSRQNPTMLRLGP
mmetsp:Transcript_13544/g.23054  ORF Transcript_13544/g.23054 Transcript_13544/m.23054 type:complete len:100 (+) Transcript_13544:593-892(+)